MKNRILFILTVIVLLAAPTASQAGFLVKKQATAQTASTTAPAAATDAQTHKSELQQIMTAVTDPLTSPSGSFVRMIESGTISVIAFLCGIVGFFIPIFAVIAVAFGFLGFSRKYFRKKGYGVAAFILGVIAITIVAFGGLAPLPFF